MIYANDAPSEASKQTPAGQQSPRQDPPSYSGPQPYPHPYSQPYPQPYPQAQAYPQPYTYPVDEPSVEPAGRRFVKAFMIAALIWLLFSLLVRTSISVVHDDWLGDDYYYDIPQDIGLHNCVQGNEWSLSSSANSFGTPTELAQLQVQATQYNYESETSFDLPLSSETLFFLTRGQLGGILHVVTASDQAQDSAKVQAIIRYDRPELRELTKACLLSRSAGENGVGIFAPQWRRFPRNGYSLSFEITVVLPEISRSSGPLLINNFETDIPNSAHLFEDLTSDRIFFESLSLKGSNGIIKTKSLKVTNGKLHTSNGQIDGTLYTTQVLTVETSNSPITVSVGLESDKNGSSPTLNLRTKNGLVGANIDLLAAAGSGGSFNVSVETSNSPLRVAFASAPVDSKLKLEAVTTNGLATVSLDPAYEGSFHLRTSNARPVVNRKSGVKDPKGQGRTRAVDYKAVGKTAYVGDIYWGDKKTNAGSVDVQTSNSPVTLNV